MSFGRERHRHNRHGLRQGHRRVLRRPAFSVQRLSARQCGGPAQGPAVAGVHTGTRIAGARIGARARAPSCSRHCAGARIRRGSSTIRISSGFRRRRSGAAERSSTGKRKSPRPSGTSLERRSEPMTKPFASIALPSSASTPTRSSRKPATRRQRSKPYWEKVSCDPASCDADITGLHKNCRGILANLHRPTLSAIELATGRPAYLDR
jgi:hypothetical protein